MELTGKIIACLGERSGQGQKGEWVSASYVLETNEQYPKKMMFELFGRESIDKINIQLGETLTVVFDVIAKEYNGKWFNSVRAWRVKRGELTNFSQPIQPSQPIQDSVQSQVVTEMPKGAKPTPEQATDLFAGASNPIQSNTDELPF